MLWKNFGNGRHSLWREMERLRHELDRFVEPSFSPAPSFPALNVWSNAEGVVVTAELPGISAEDIDVSVVGETLTVQGTRWPESADEDTKYHRRERGYGQFTRTLQLPYLIEADKVEATFDKGILWLNLPRAEADKPKKITVKRHTN